MSIYNIVGSVLLIEIIKTVFLLAGISAMINYISNIHKNINQHVTVQLYSALFSQNAHIFIKGQNESKCVEDVKR